MRIRVPGVAAIRDMQMIFGTWNSVCVRACAIVRARRRAQRVRFKVKIKITRYSVHPPSTHVEPWQAAHVSNRARCQQDRRKGCAPDANLDTCGWRPFCSAILNARGGIRGRSMKLCS